MRCIWLPLFLFYFRSASAYYDGKVLQTLQDVKNDLVVSEDCQNAVELYIDNLRSAPKDDQWAMQMLDATSKIPVGLLSLNFGELGQFSQCLNTESAGGQIQGKYCLGVLNVDLDFYQENQIKINETLQKQAYQLRKAFGAAINTRAAGSTEGLGITWAICLPRNCTDEDVAGILNQILGTQAAVCQTKDDLSPPLTGGAIATIVILAIFAFVLVQSTVLDLYFRHMSREPPYVIFVAFSVYSNGAKLFKMSKNSNELTCLNGIRFFSMMWVVIGHVYCVYGIMAPTTNFKDIMEWLGTIRSMVIISGTLSVDTFLFLSGLLIAYSFLKAKHRGVKFNIFQFYIHRYLRLTPVLAVTVLVTANLLKYMGSGPKWSGIDFAEEGCQKYWWTTLLYVQNYVNDKNYFCLGQTWYLSVDMQLYVISPLLLMPLWKYPKIGVALIFAGIIAFILTPFGIAYAKELCGLMTNIQPPCDITDFMWYYYTKTHARAAPWFIGILLGYILAEMKFHNKFRQLKVNKVIILLLWGVFLAVGLACVYGGNGTIDGPDYDKWANSFYIALVRPVWTLCISWVVLACVTGNGGPIDWLLSLPIYQLLNRFTYSIYLIHYPLLILICYMVKSGVYFDEFSMAYNFWGITMFSFGLSVIWVLAFESPITVLEKVMFGSPNRSNKVEESRNKDGLTA